MPSKTELFIYGFFLWIFSDVFINLCWVDNVYQERLIWLFFAIMINLFFALKLKKKTEMRWSILLLMVCLGASYIVSLSVIGYGLYAYYRYQKSKLPTTLELNEIDKMQNATNGFQSLFQGIRVRFLCLWFISGQIISVVFAVRTGVYWFDSKDILVLSNLTYVGFFGLLLFWILKKCEKHKVDFRQFFCKFSIKPYWFKGLLLLLGLIFLGSGLQFLILYIESFFFPAYVQDLLIDNPLASDGGNLTFLNRIICGIIIVIIAPILEEILFRGIILHRLAMKWNLNRAIVISSMLFGIVHANDAIGAFFVGMVLAVVFIKVKSIFAPISLHMLNNALAYGTLWIALYEPTTTVQDLQSDIWGGILYIVFSLPLVIYYLKKNWPNKKCDLPLFVQESSCSIDGIKSPIPFSDSNN